MPSTKNPIQYRPPPLRITRQSRKGTTEQRTLICPRDTASIAPVYFGENPSDAVERARFDEDPLTVRFLNKNQQNVADSKAASTKSKAIGVGAQ